MAKVKRGLLWPIPILLWMAACLGVSAEGIASDTTTSGIAMFSTGMAAPTYETPQESYNQELAMFEEKFTNGRLFDVSVPNGDSTRDAVKLDLPSNFTFSLEKDGKVTPYKAGALIDENGYYILTVTAPPLGNSGASVGIYKFRILPPPSAGSAKTTTLSKAPVIYDAVKIGKDESLGLNRYEFSNYRAFYTNIKNGDTVSTTAQFLFPGGLTFSLTKDGKVQSYKSMQMIDSPGQYVMAVYAPSIASTGVRAVRYTLSLHFTVAGSGIDGTQTGSGSDLGTTSGDSGGWLSGLFGSGGSGSTQTQGGSGSTQTATGPTKEELKEILHEDQALYEEQFANGTVFYTNVANGSISAGPVKLDIPSNMTYSLEKDGTVMEYVSRNDISDEGAYLLILTPGKILNEKIDSYAVYTFKISKPSGDGSQTISGGQSMDNDSQTTAAADTAEGTQPEDTGSGSKQAEPSRTTSESEKADEAKTNATKQEVIPSQSFDTESMMFVQSIAEGIQFTTSVPNGITINEQVSMNIPDSLTVTLFLGDQKIAYKSGGLLTDAGAYRAELTGDSLPGKAVVFRFRIIGEETNAGQAYDAPLGYSITAVTINDKAVTPFSPAASFEMKEDAQYGFVLKSSLPNAKSYEVGFRLDRVAPTLSFKGIKDGKVTEKSVSFELTDSMDKVAVTKNGKAISLMENVLKVNGKYTVTVTDKAGNSTSYAFSIPYRMSATSVLIILLLLVMLGGGAYYFMRMKNKVSVR